MTIIRRFCLRPYRKGGVSFTLLLFHLGGGRGWGRQLGYRLTVREGGITQILFESWNYRSPNLLGAADSAPNILALFRELTQQPEGTAASALPERLTTLQQYYITHAAVLWTEAQRRFGKETQ